MHCKIGIKFCGGCNPNYDRVAALERIQSRLSSEVEFVRFDCKNIDFILFIKGCDTECVDLNRFGLTPQVRLTRWEDIQSVITQIENF